MRDNTKLPIMCRQVFVSITYLPGLYHISHAVNSRYIRRQPTERKYQSAGRHDKHAMSLNSLSAGIDFRRQNLTFVDVRF